MRTPLGCCCRARRALLGARAHPLAGRLDSRRRVLLEPGPDLGVLRARRRRTVRPLRRSARAAIAPLAALAVLLGVWLGGLWHSNPGGGLEFIWIGAPLGIRRRVTCRASSRSASCWCSSTASPPRSSPPSASTWDGSFADPPAAARLQPRDRGQPGRDRALRALSWFAASPGVWFAVGSLLLVLLLALVPWRPMDAARGCSALAAIGHAVVELGAFVWSPYYRISLSPLAELARARGGGSGASESRSARCSRSTTTTTR